MKARLNEVKDLGAATAEEWFKGLEADGKKKAAGSARWEQWESLGGFQAISPMTPEARHAQRPDLEPRHHYSSNCEKQSTSSFAAGKENGNTSIKSTAITHPHPWTNQGMHFFTTLQPALVGLGYFQTDSCKAPPSTLPAKPATPISSYGLGYQGAVSNFSQQAPKPQTRVERSIHDVNEKKNARRAEIERRCAELDTPIQPSTLAFMDSFAAALQIAMPLTDQAWELLKPRLLAQREAAEQQEREQLAQNQFLMQQTEERKQQEAQLKEAKETLDRDWEDSQKSVREKLETYADNFVREQWQNGGAITKESCAQFAADMLLHVRHRFYTSLAQEDGRMRAMGIPILMDSPHPGPSRKLTLENMRWVYENKIKPLTERFQKELFLCNACDNHGRYYSLDSVVQHFAAKHTDSLSMGTAVVYWKADWPELPPFDPNPTAAKASMYISANPPPAFPPGELTYSAQSAYHGHATGTHMSPDQTIYPSSLNGYDAYGGPSPRYNNASPAYAEASSPQHASQGIAQQVSQIFQYPQTPTNAPVQRYIHPPPLDHHDWRRQQGPINSVASYQKHFTTAYPGQTPEFAPRPGSALSYVSRVPSYSGIPPSCNQFSRLQPRQGVRPAFNNLPPGQPMGIYQVQIQDLAHNARDVWNGTSDVSDMPDSVRVQVIIRHVVLRFKDKYTNEPNLALFTDGLNNNSQMSPMRALNSLTCKACAIVGRMTGGYGDNNTQATERQMHTLPALLAHFQSAHVEHVQPIAISPTGIEMPRLDWKFDMVEMPQENVVGNLIYSRGMTQAKLHLISSVLPSYFPSPLPQVDPNPRTGNHDTAVLGFEARKIPEDSDFHETNACATKAPFGENETSAGHFQQFPAKRDEGHPQGSAYRSRDAPNPLVSKSAESAGEDEYDPHRPAYVNPNPSERPSPVRPEYPDHGPHHGYQAFPAHGIINDPRVHQNVEAITYNHRASPSTGYTAPITNKPPSGRLDSDAQDLTSRNMSTFEPKSHWDGQGSRPGLVERRITPPEPLNAAEQFLQSFDLGPDTLHERNQPTPAVGTSKRDEYGLDVPRDSGYRPRSSDHTWVSDRLNARPVEYSRTSSPSDPIPAVERYHMADDAMAEPHQARQYDCLYSSRLPDPQTRKQRSLAASPDNQMSSRARASHLHPHLKAVRDSPSRRPNSRFERYEAQRQESQRPQTRSPGIAAEPLSVDDTVYHHPSSKPRPAPLPIYASQTEERYRDYPYAEEVMYRRAPQAAQQIRYVENPRFLERTYDGSVEYVRVAPRDSQVAGGYYVQRAAAHDGADEYIGYEPSRPHEQVFQRNGQLYTRAPTSPKDYRDPYARQVTYE
jgi:hypothetical protein